MLLEERQSSALKHLRDCLAAKVDDRIAKQRRFDADRLQWVKDALLMQPEFLPIQIAMPANVANIPKGGKTDDQTHTTIITGAISDGEKKKVVFRRTNVKADPFISVSENADVQLSLDAIAGKSVESGGAVKIEKFAPFPLTKNESLTVQVLNPVELNNIDIVSIVITGFQVFSQASVDERLTDQFIADCQKAIELRYAPETRFAVCPVKFDDKGDAYTETNAEEEAHFIWGARTNVKNAMLSLGIRKDQKFSNEYFPIWGFAAEDGNVVETFRFLDSPIFVDKGETLKMSLKNTINRTTFAQNKDDASIELYRTTL